MSSIERCVENRPETQTGLPDGRLKRSRYKELLEIAYAVLAIIDGAGVKQEEGCTLSQLVETLFYMKKD
jgi:hypothetical protein